MAEPTVKIDLRPLERFAVAIRNDGPHIRAGLKQWGARYLGDMRRQFVTSSRGGGGWAPLKTPTIRARRKGGKKRGGVSGAVGGRRPRAGILRDTGTLFAALNPGAAGNEFRDIKHGVVVGYGGSGSHPKGRATIADIARFHQTGAGHLPPRPIIRQPMPETIAGMMSDMARAIQAQGRASQ